MCSELLTFIVLLISVNCQEIETTDKLDGNWSPLIILNGNQKFCEARANKNRISIKIKNNGSTYLEQCNKIEFEYLVSYNQLTIIDTGKPRTELGCDKLNNQLEDIWEGIWNYKLSDNGDSLVLFKSKEDIYIKLVKTELFDSTIYAQFYKQNDCKWPWTDDLKSSQTLFGEPIFNGSEYMPRLCSNNDPQKVIEENLFLTESMVRMKIYDKVIIRVIIDKCGKIQGTSERTEIDTIHQDAIYHVLDILSCWHPATIDDEPVNIYYPLVFDFRKLNK